MYDYIVIGSGFGGSVSAMRLAEKGYSVLVIEKGKKYSAENFPKTNWNLRKYLWIPALRFFGFQKPASADEMSGVFRVEIVWGSCRVQVHQIVYRQSRQAGARSPSG